MNIILGYLLAINIATFFLYGIDKYKAKKDNRRQAESNIKLALNIAEARQRKAKPTEDYKGTDHIGGLLKEGKVVFPNAEVYVNHVEAEAWLAMEGDRSQLAIRTHGITV